jgi:tetratricopeptide (TPR) repeat protein
MNTKGISAFFEENWKFVLSLVAVLVVVGGTVGIWNERKKAREKEATNFLYDTQVSVRALSEQKKFKEAEAALQPLLEKYPGTRAAYEAQLQMGDLWMENGAFAEAVKSYQLAADNAKDAFSKLLAKYNLGIAEESAGKFQEAVASYDDAMKVEGSDFLKPEILMAQARCFEALKNLPKAAEIYQQIQKDFASRSYYSGAAAAFERLLSAGSN